MEQQLALTFLKAHGQTKLLESWDLFNENEKRTLCLQLNSLALPEIWSAWKALNLGTKAKLSVSPIVPCVTLASQREACKMSGKKAIVQGKVCLMTVAGGLAERLGLKGPKGCFPITPVEKLSLFEVFAQKIQAYERIYSVTFPWVIVTSPQNHVETIHFFQKHRYFGLSGQDIFFACQGVLPYLDESGQLVLEWPQGFVVAPDGHGGSFFALQKEGILKALKARGIRYISYFQVDNPLLTIVDPMFIGHHIAERAAVSTKVVQRIDPEEKVGILVRDLAMEKLALVEYKYFPETLSQARAQRGEGLLFRWANIAAHIWNVDFVEMLLQANPFRLHGQRQADGRTKWERLIFDALPVAEHAMLFEVDREEEFSPVKNAEGKDSPRTCQMAWQRQWASWLAAAGQPVVTDETGLPKTPLEVSPLEGPDRAVFLASRGPK